jgi:hypothetical protein
VLARVGALDWSGEAGRLGCVVLGDVGVGWCRDGADNLSGFLVVHSRRHPAWRGRKWHRRDPKLQ